MHRAFLELNAWLARAGIDPASVVITIEFATRHDRMTATNQSVLENGPPLSMTTEALDAYLRGKTEGIMCNTPYRLTDRGMVDFREVVRGLEG